MSNDGYFLEASTSRCKKQMLELSSTSNSNHTVAEKSSVNLFQQGIVAEVKQLEGRLRVLEEETEMLKGALLESKKLITEIHHHFNTMKHRQELYSPIAQSTALCTDKRAGLLQVLCQESNPSIVNKGNRTKEALGEIAIQFPSDLM